MFLCGRSIEEVLAWKYYEEMKACYERRKRSKESRIRALES